MLRSVMAVCAIVGLCVSCAGDDSEPEEAAASDAVAGSSEDFDHEIENAEFRATVRCGDGHGVAPVARGTFENRTELTAAFQVWVVWKKGERDVDVSSGPTETLAPGDLGSWQATAPSADVDACEVGCVVAVDPADPIAAAENCSGAPLSGSAG